MTLKGSGPASRIYFSQRLRLHYVDWASRRASATPRPRRTGHCRNWDWVAAALRYDWHLLAPDLRGHGDSQWSPDGNYTIAGYVYDLTQLIHQQELAPLTMKRGVAERMQDWIAEQRALSGRAATPQSKTLSNACRRRTVTCRPIRRGISPSMGSTRTRTALTAGNSTTMFAPIRL